MALLFCPFLCVFFLGGGEGLGKLIVRGEKMFNLFTRWNGNDRMNIHGGNF